MDIYLRNHGYKYAVEQMLLTLFPGERPRYPETEPSFLTDYLISEFTVDADSLIVSSRAVLCIKGAVSEGRAEHSLTSQLHNNILLFDRMGQKLVKLAFFRAADSFLDNIPPWGSITGVHPAKIALRYMEENSCGKEEAVLFLQGEYTVSHERALLCADAAEAALSVKRSLCPGDISLYVGIPFCPTRCSYCSFVSQSVEKSMNLIEPYLNALHREIASVGELAAGLGLNVVSVYIGGGTPTTLTSEQLKTLMSRLSDSFDLSRCAEYTVEAGRPDTITDDKITAIEKGGATRISINPQSMNDGVLAAIGRRHSGQDILDCFCLARGHFSGVINMDLIAGLPADTAEGFENSLNAVIGLDPENITVHTLTAKRGSRLTADGAIVSDTALTTKMLDCSISALRNAGYGPYYLYRQKFSSGGYENVGWSKKGYTSIYNIVMMEELHSVISLGAGGVTKLVDKTTGKIKRITNKKYPQEYINAIDDIIKEKNYIREFCSDTKKHLHLN